MTQAFFAFLTSIALIFAPIFGLSRPIEESAGLAFETEPQSDDYSVFDRIYGVSDSVFYIKRPNVDFYKTVYASEFGMSEDNGDNYFSFSKAVDYCRENPYTHLIIGKGDYYFRTQKQIDLSNLTNVIIDGDGAKLYFSSDNYFNIANSDCIELTDFSVHWNDENTRLASIVKIKNADKKNHTLDIEFTELDNVDENTEISAFTQYDPETLTPGTAKGAKEKYIYSDPDIIISREKNENNVLRIKHNGELDDFSNGEIYLLRHHVYGGNVFNVSNSSNITFSSVAIFSAAGMGWLITDRCERFQLLNCEISLDDAPNAERISTTADGVHIANTKGKFKIENCDFSFMGDDALNVHDNVYTVTDKNDVNTLTLFTNAPTFKTGDTAQFFDSEYNNLDFTATVTGINGNCVTFDRDIPDEVKPGCIAANGDLDSSNYVVSNNYIHENRARGFMLQSSNGLCENNTFYKTMGNAIKVVVDISNGNWLEGTGVNTLEIKNNSFLNCNVSDWGAIIDVSSNINGKTADNAMFKNIKIAENLYKNSSGNVLTASNTNNLEFANNEIINTNGKIILNKHNSNIKINANSSDSVFGVRVILRSLSALF